MAVSILSIDSFAGFGKLWVDVSGQLWGLDGKAILHIALTVGFHSECHDEREGTGDDEM